MLAGGDNQAPASGAKKADKRSPAKNAAAGRGWQQVTASLLVYRGARQDSSQAWLLTFTDLSALMLTFFVLLFSMSAIDERQWQNLVDAFSPHLAGLQTVTVTLPNSDQTMDEVERLPGTDLDYLAAVLQEQVAANAALKGAEVRLASDRLVVSMPGELLFAPGATSLTSGGEKAVFALSGVLRSLRNVIEVAGHADPSRPGSRYDTNWELSLARAAAVSGLLSELGYRGDVLVRGYGHTRFDEIGGEVTGSARLAQARRVDVVVHSYAAEAR